MKRRAAVFQRKENLYVHSDSKAVTGAWISSPPFISLKKEDSDAAIGTAVREALRGSLDGVPHPTDLETLFQPMYDLAGVKSWGAFVRGAVSCQVTENDGLVSLKLREKRGAGFVPRKENAVELESPSDEELGAAVKRVLDSMRK